MTRQVGICSLCGGRVIGPDNRYTTQPSYSVHCESCYTTKELLPTIDMGKANGPIKRILEEKKK